MDRPPLNYIIRIDNMYLAQLMFCWVYYNQPCSILIHKPNTEGLTAVKVVVDNDDAASFILRLKEKTNCLLYEVNR